nr:MAG TPA: hypothetical protein [Caudoviricetes sp.]
MIYCLYPWDIYSLSLFLDRANPLMLIYSYGESRVQSLQYTTMRGYCASLTF